MRRFVFVYSEGRGAEEASRVLVSWCHGTNVAAPQCTHLHLREGVEGAGGERQRVGVRLRTRPVAAAAAGLAGRVGRGAGRRAAAAELGALPHRPRVIPVE